jgi:hypothetical protein
MYFLIGRFLGLTSLGTVIVTVSRLTGAAAVATTNSGAFGSSTTFISLLMIGEPLTIRRVGIPEELGRYGDVIFA